MLTIQRKVFRFRKRAETEFRECVIKKKNKKNEVFKWHKQF